MQLSTVLTPKVGRCFYVNVVYIIGLLVLDEPLEAPGVATGP